MFGIEEIVFWHWWVIAVVLIVLELIATAYFFLWLGAAAAVIGLLLLAMPDLSWQLQIGLWAVLSITAITVSYLRRKKCKQSGHNDNGEELVLNQRGNQYIGRTFTLEEAIINGQGKLNVDDTTWKIEASEDMDKGTKVIVKSVDSTILKVTKA